MKNRFAEVFLLRSIENKTEVVVMQSCVCRRGLSQQPTAWRGAEMTQADAFDDVAERLFTPKVMRTHPLVRTKWDVSSAVHFNCGRQLLVADVSRDRNEGTQ